jgi:nitrate reductase gamma subunit
MAEALMVIVYGGIAVFLIAVVAKVVKIKSFPMHVRWEVYPVAHEGKRAEHGGSFMEQLDWWKKERHVDKLAELRSMVPEILFLVALREHNPRLWLVSFPFHFGLYTLAGAAAFIIAGAIFQAVTGTVLDPATASVLGTILYWGAAALWIGGLALALAGGLGLLVRRLTDEDLKPYTTFGHVFNLLLFLATFGVAAWHLVAYDTSPLLGGVRGVVQGLVTLEAAEMTVPLFVHVALLAVMLAYIPLTHMSHFFTKYFLYHDIRWDDAPNLKGGELEPRIQELLGYKVSWAAPHIHGEGKKSWLDVAVENPADAKDEEKA